MNYYAALDVSLRTVNLCVIDEQGEIKAEAKLASEVEEIAYFLHGLDYEVSSVGLEAGTLTQYLTYGLQSAGFEVICMEARQVKAALSAMRNKTGFTLISRTLSKRPIMAREERHAEQKKVLGGV